MANSPTPLTIVLAQPRGFCAGVERAIEIVEKALEKYGAPVYVRHEIVHNKWVVDTLSAKGVIFVKEVDEIPDGAVTIFSAHGISEAVENSALDRNLPVLDATCPLVTKVHYQAKRYERDGSEIILIGHEGHPEVEGTSGRVKKVHLVSDIDDVEKLELPADIPLAYVTQTTLSVDDTRDIIAALRAKYPDIQGPDVNDICYATQNRQQAVREISQDVDLLLVVGARNSSNSNRLRDLGEENGIPSYLISDEKDIKLEWFDGVSRVGITAGASAPEILIERVQTFLSTQFDTETHMHDGIVETIKFNLPKALRQSA
ncbi:MAG: 4-hydroxy-3-methylbut-2-enyl diphosphate reductase [Rickettsiales bacterium]|nr:4-hydroxy-3-methylbut-2-enyl diphosphate reductase [Rickettsiales bacterium]